MEEKIMNVAEEGMAMEETMVEVCEARKLGTGAIALIAAGAIGVGFAAYKFGKKLWDKHKAKKNPAELVVDQNGNILYNECECKHDVE